MTPGAAHDDQNHAGFFPSMSSRTSTAPKAVRQGLAVAVARGAEPGPGPCVRPAPRGGAWADRTHRQHRRAAGSPPQGTKCQGMEGLIGEAREIIETAPPGALRDAVLIAGAQKAEHDEIRLLRHRLRAGRAARADA